MTNLINGVGIHVLLNEANAADVLDAQYFALDLESFDLRQEEEISEWVRRQPVPVIGVGDRDIAYALHMDLQVSNRRQLSQLITAIEARPKACAILVQVTRITPELPANSALIVESLAYSTLQGGEEFQVWLTGYKQAIHRELPAMVANPVMMDRKDSRLQIRLNSPDNRNALSVPMREGLTEAFKLVAMDSSIKEVDVSADGPCFSSGGDLSEFGETSDVAEAHRIRQARMPARYLVQAWHRYTFNLHGACIGAGIELPAFAKHITATTDTWFRLPEIKMGLIPGAGGCVSIPRRIGRQRTNWMAITGEALDAKTALEWGLVDRIVEAKDLE